MCAVSVSGVQESGCGSQEGQLFSGLQAQAERGPSWAHAVWPVPHTRGQAPVSLAPVAPRSTWTCHRQSQQRETSAVRSPHTLNPPGQLAFGSGRLLRFPGLRPESVCVREAPSVLENRGSQIPCALSGNTNTFHSLSRRAEHRAQAQVPHSASRPHPTGRQCPAFTAAAH